VGFFTDLNCREAAYLNHALNLTGILLVFARKSVQAFKSQARQVSLNNKSIDKTQQHLLID
jgi:hypothetical protein